MLLRNLRRSFLCPAEIAEIAEIFPAEGRSCVAVSKGDLSAISAISAGPINININRTLNSLSYGPQRHKTQYIQGPAVVR